MLIPEFMDLALDSPSGLDHPCLSDINLSFPKPESHDELQFGNNIL
jgi:hypothetical protein